MKTILALTAPLLALCILPTALLAQGSLTPPGAPAATMKSLDQIYAKLDARIPITNSASLVTIAQPGSYYLTGNLTVSTGDGIDINTNNVTLDLNGYTIASTAATAIGAGIDLNSGWSDITLCNGHIRGAVTNNGSGVYGGGGFTTGITFSGNTPMNVLVSRVSVSGCRYYGINLNAGSSTVVEACTVRAVGSYGIYASTVKHCSALDCGSYAIFGDTISDSSGQSSGSSYGIYANNTALNCYGQSSSGYGIYASITALNCYGQSSSGYGLYSVTAQNCCGVSSTSIGLSATDAQNCYGLSYGTSIGLDTYTAQNCYGLSCGNGYGLYAFCTASGCHGQSSSGIGLYAGNASSCTGYRSGGTAIQATVATGCYAIVGTNIINFKYNMP